MGSVDKRLRALEGKKDAAASRKWEIPIEVQTLLKAQDRYRAREQGKEPPPYSREEIAELRQSDIRTAAGSFRDDVGWQSPEARALLDEWEESARRRLDMAEGLPPERWGEVWGDDEHELLEEGEDGWLDRT